MDLKSILSEEEYKVYIKSEMLKEISNNNYQAIYDILINNNLVEVDTKDNEPKNEEKKRLIRKQEIAKIFEDANYEKVLRKTETNIKNKFSYLLRDICNSAKIQNKIYKIDNKVIGFYSEGHFYITLEYYKQYFKTSKKVRWHVEFGEYWEHSRFINSKSMSGSIVPYKLKGIEISNNVVAFTAFKMSNELLKELGYYNDLVGIHSDYK
ncbi:hypothetical protein [Mammaliicoccus sciuri]|uniref:hypothetical protein n=1 Tax=Mammaliicoccus sciuri TaxID=1296 RepID=UPI003CF54B68